MSEHHHSPSLKNINRAFYIGIVLNALYTLLEFVIGYQTNSLALISDASHNLSDVASLILSLIGLKLSQKASSKLYTYGYKKASILASLINAILLIIVSFGIIKEGVLRLNAPPLLAGNIIMYTASIGVVINTISAFLFFKGQKKDINLKGAFLHLLVDALVSIGVVVSGIIIHYTSWNIIDPLISFVIGFIIIITTWSLLKESIRLVLDGIPKDIDPNEIKKLIANHPNIKDVHHIHIWALSSTENALTAHLILKEAIFTPEKILEIKQHLKNILNEHNIQHITLETETSKTKIADPDAEEQLQSF